MCSSESSVSLPEGRDIKISRILPEGSVRNVNYKEEDEVEEERGGERRRRRKEERGERIGERRRRRERGG